MMSPQKLRNRSQIILFSFTWLSVLCMKDQTSLLFMRKDLGLQCGSSSSEISPGGFPKVDLWLISLTMYALAHQIGFLRREEPGNRLILTFMYIYIQDDGGKLIHKNSGKKIANYIFSLVKW